MGFWDNSLKILTELEKNETDSNKLLTLKLVKDALSMRKRSDINGAKELLRQALTYEKNLNEDFLYFVNISYYDAVANSEVSVKAGLLFLTLAGINFLICDINFTQFFINLL